ncbi:TPA: hypothetical protein ACF2DD_002127 [Clostridium perfringens]
MREFKKNNYTICDLCRRNQGFNDDDVYICKYNKDNVGIGWSNTSKISKNKRFKCKYFKRQQEYVLSNFMWKGYEHYNSKIGRFKITYKQGKFIVRKTNK